MCSLLRMGNVAKFLSFTLSPKKQKRSTIDYKTRGVRLHDDPKERLRIKLYRLQHLAIPCSVWVFFGKQDNCSSMCTQHHKLFCHTQQIIVALVRLMCCLPLSLSVWLPSNSFSVLQRTKRLSPAVNYSLLMPLWRVSSLFTKVIILIQIPAVSLVALLSFYSTMLPD